MLEECKLAARFYQLGERNNDKSFLWEGNDVEGEGNESSFLLLEQGDKANKTNTYRRGGCCYYQ